MDQTKRVPIQATKQLKALMAQHFMELDEAARTKNKKIAWCTSVGPAELAAAFGFLVYYPENHAAILGANRSAMDYIPVANAAGYSPDICSYLTSDVGAYLKGEPVGGRLHVPVRGRRVGGEGLGRVRDD